MTGKISLESIYKKEKTHLEKIADAQTEWETKKKLEKYRKLSEDERKVFLDKYK